MLKLKSKQIVLFLGDTALAALTLFFALAARFLTFPAQERFVVHAELFVPLYIVSIALYYSFDFYDFSPFQSKVRQFSRLVNIHLFVALVGFGYFYLFATYTELTPKTVLVLYTGIHILVSTVWRLFIVPTFFRPQARAKTLLIAEAEEYQELKETVNSHTF